MTSAGKYKSLFDELPNEVGDLVSIIQGLVLYEHVASEFYSVEIPNERRSESHFRSTEQMLKRLLELDDKPLTVARPPEKRLVGVCHHFMLLLVAMLRAKGIPARARCGFGAYFNPGYFEDHWVCEYWNAAQSRWQFADPQFDEIWREKLKIKHDVLDVPRDQFLTSADAWERCRAGKANSAKFGIHFSNLRGLWFVAGDLVRDLAALNKTEMLPWDTWGAMPKPYEQLDEAQLEFFDRLAVLAHKPDETFDGLRETYETNDMLHVPVMVFNALLNRPEAVEAGNWRSLSE
jgi:hypothetical protein